MADAQGQSLAYVYSRKSVADASIAAVLTEDLPSLAVWVLSAVVGLI